MNYHTKRNGRYLRRVVTDNAKTTDKEAESMKDKLKLAARILANAGNPVAAWQCRNLSYFVGIAVGQLLTIAAFFVGRLIG